MKTIYLVGGTMGVGKTATCRHLQKSLPDCVLLDGDWCWDMHPFVVNAETKQMVMDNICFLLNNFIGCSVYRHIVFCWVLHEQAILDELLARIATEGCRVIAVSLVCGEQALRRRLERDITGGLRDADIVERSVARLPLYRQLRTQMLDVSEISPGEAAACIRQMGRENGQ